jgi:hypothetical protein
MTTKCEIADLLRRAFDAGIKQAGEEALAYAWRRDPWQSDDEAFSDFIEKEGYEMITPMLRIDPVSTHLISEYNLHPQWRVYLWDGSKEGKVRVTGALAYPAPEGHPNRRPGDPVWGSPLDLKRTFTLSAEDYHRIIAEDSAGLTNPESTVGET